ncbi:hypothetical protein DFJ43DRAFT_1228205 [Lentinula guzmanii]|uniref:Terpenoid synthase n=1 Tax=Lentinula guzmanii TaxID=2804957 RepID=A0AA38JDH0_9AGAR|nr:hypothetical protein DFJ43DRAFT_1228205 [Lentinula guzmanii]
MVMDRGNKNDIDITIMEKCKKAVLDTMQVLNIDPLAIVPFDQSPTFNPFVARCIEAARQRNYLTDAFQEKHVIIGAAAAHHAYLFHEGTESHNVPVLSSLLMAFIYFIDDHGFQQRSIAEFGSRLVSGRSQLEKGLDDIVAATTELADMYTPITGDLLRLTIQAYVMSNQLEEELESGGVQSKWQVNKDAPFFPTIMKTFTSCGTLAYLLSFPCNINSTSYIQALVDGIWVHDITSDIMSYYKEAINGEFTRIEQVAQMQGLSGSAVLEDLVKTMAQSHERVIRVLSASDPSGSLLLYYTRAIRGFVVFQALYPRYKIADFGIFSF